VRERRFRGGGGKGKELEFVSEAMRMTVLEGFKVRKEMAQESGRGEVSWETQSSHPPV